MLIKYKKEDTGVSSYENCLAILLGARYCTRAISYSSKRTPAKTVGVPIINH